MFILKNILWYDIKIIMMMISLIERLEDFIPEHLKNSQT